MRERMRQREIAAEQEHLDAVYQRLDEKVREAEFLWEDAQRVSQLRTPGALAERDAMVHRAGRHLHHLNAEFEDFVFGRIDLLGHGGRAGLDPDEDPTPVAAPTDPTAAETATAGQDSIGEVLHIGRIGVLDADYDPLVVDWRAPAAAPFYRATPLHPGRVVRRRVLRSRTDRHRSIGRASGRWPRAAI